MEIDVFISYHTDSSKHIVEAIVNKLESVGVRCWYAPRDVKGIYAESIMTAIESCKIFLLILNKAASESKHVLNELEQATDRLGENIEQIIPFKISSDEISKGTQYYIKRIHWIDAVSPPMHERIDELSEKIASMLGEDIKRVRPTDKIGTDYKLISKLPQPRLPFEGRNKEIKEIEAFFNAGNRVVFVEGIGGIGKSEIAKHYAVEYQHEYDNMLFVTYNGSLELMVCDPIGIEIQGLEQGQKDAKELFEQKIKIIRSICDETTLIIVDNFDVDNDKDFEAFIEGSHRVIFTTRNTHSGYPTVKVKPIESEEDLFLIFKQNYDGEIAPSDRKILKQLFELVENHTYMIELLAKQMKASYLSTTQLYDLVKTGKLRSNINETILGRKEQKTAFMHMETLFNVSNLNMEEKLIMSALSIVGPGGIVANRFKEWMELSDFNLVTSLVERSWIRAEGNKFSLHPLVAEVVRVNLKPTYTNIKKIINNMADFAHWAWHRPYNKNLEIADNVSSVLAYFQPFSAEIAMYIEPMSSFLWQVGRFEESIKWLHILYNTCLKEFGEANMVTGFVAKGLGGAYFNSRREKESVQWYEKGLDHMLKANGGDSEDLAVAYIKVARCYTWEFNFNPEKAKEYFNKALDIRIRLNDMFKKGKLAPPETLTPFKEYSEEEAERNVAGINIEIGRMYQVLGEYENALKHAEIYKNYMENDKQQIKSNIAYGLYDMGVCQYHLGREKSKDEADAYFAEAEKNLKKALELNMEMRGGLAVDTIDNQEYLGDLYATTNRFSEASNAYMAVVNMLEKLYGEDYERIETVKEKMKF